MEANLTKGSCGNCGNQTFEIYKPEDEERLICQCTKCKNTSEITVTKPKIDIGWHGESKGILHF